MVGCEEALASQDAVNASLAKVLETQVLALLYGPQ